MRLPETDKKTADYLYRDVLLIELKEVRPPTAKVRWRLYREMLREAGLVSTTRSMSFAQIAALTKRPGYWRSRVENLFFRPVENLLRTGKEQIFETRRRLEVPYGIIFVAIDGDEATQPGDFDVLTAKMIHRCVSHGDPEIASVSAIVLFHQNYILSDASRGDGYIIQQLATEDGIHRRGYEAFLTMLFDDISRHGTMDTDYVDDFWYPESSKERR